MGEREEVNACHSTQGERLADELDATAKRLYPNAHQLLDDALPSGGARELRPVDHDVSKRLPWERKRRLHD